MLWTILQTESTTGDAAFPLGLACLFAIVIGGFLLYAIHQGNQRGGPR